MGVVDVLTVNVNVDVSRNRRASMPQNPAYYFKPGPVLQVVGGKEVPQSMRCHWFNPVAFTYSLNSLLKAALVPVAPSVVGWKEPLTFPISLNPNAQKAPG